MNNKLLPLSLLILASLTSCSSDSNNSDSNNDTAQQTSVAVKDVCPVSQSAKTIDMKDMSLSYFKYKDHICGTLDVDLSENASWSKDGSGWFAAGFGAPTMKGSKMFIFVPTNTGVNNAKYDVFANIGGGFGPTESLDTEPKQGQIKILSSSLGKVSFALYPDKVDGLSSDDKKIDMIFSHSKAGVTVFAPGHIAKYDGYSLDFN